MAKDDIFKIIYVILKELYENKKEGLKTPIEDISPERFTINEQYWASIICDLIDNKYIVGVNYRHTKSGRVLTGLKDIEITLKGIEFLQENSMMKKVHEVLKAVKDIVPGI